LTDQQWKIIEPLLPKRKSKVGRPPIDSRQVLNGIIYILKTGCAWADLPRKYGSPTTCWRRLRDWQKLGIWDRIWRKLLQLLDEQDKLDLSQVYLDGSFVPAKRGGDEIGTTKIGKGSKIMLVAERNGVPIGLHVTSAQPHELRLAEKALASIRIPGKRGRPKKRFGELVADRAYHSQEFRRFLRKRGIKVTIPVKKNTKKKKGRPMALGDGYKQRWKIERCFAWLDNYRRLIVRHERLIQHYKAFCYLALILLCLNRIV
jgi:transposase